MSIFIEINGKRESINPSKLKKIDEGGEGIIYACSEHNCAIKIFHSPETDQQPKLSQLERCLKNGRNLFGNLEKYATIPKNLVRSEGGVVLDSKGNLPASFVSGYTMENCQGFVEINNLYSEDFCQKNKIGLKDVLLFFFKLHQGLSTIHNAGFIVGDLSGNNILISLTTAEKNTRFIDTDSWGIRRPDIGLTFDPSALNEEVIHPERLNAEKNGKQLPSFLPKHDWWSLAYLLAKCLTKQDPFEQGNFWDCSAEIRRQKGMTAVHSGINLGSAENYANHLRIGIMLKHFLKRWLSCSEEGVFPLSLLEHTYNEMISCPKCKREINSRLTLCPFPDCICLL